MNLNPKNFKLVYVYMLIIYKIIDKSIRFLNSLLADPIEYIKPLYEDEEKTMADLNRAQMSEDGERADGSKIQPPYTTLTQRIKESKRQEFKHVTLKDTGAFHRSLEAEVLSEGIAFDASDSKKKDLQEKYDKEKKLFGLTDENLSFLNEEIILPELEKKLLRDLEKLG